MSSFSLPVECVELTVVKPPSRVDETQPVIIYLCRLEPYGCLVELRWNRSSRRPFPETLKGVKQGSIIFVTGRFSGTLFKYSGDLLFMKSIAARKVTDREYRNYQDGCSVPVRDDSYEKNLSLGIKYFEKRVELDRILERMEKMKISSSLAP